MDTADAQIWSLEGFLPATLHRTIVRSTELYAGLGKVVLAASTVLGDNKLVFFPGYTDHGPGHVRDVLATMAKLVPEGVDDQLGPADVVVMTLAAVLHDLAMHLSEPGFVLLKDGGWPSATAAASGGLLDSERFGDRLWPDLWREFSAEARKWEDRQRERVMGPRPTDDGPADAPGTPGPALAWAAYDVPAHRGGWTTYHRLLVGEFLRRHHARLAHEFAHHGFPGLTPTEFPPAAASLPEDLADLAGLVARSHWMTLRAAADDVRKTHNADTVRQGGCLAIYHMALLRVADYLQVQSRRAPAALLHLRDPASRVSVEAWAKHAAVREVNWNHVDQSRIHISVGRDHALRTHLQLRDLFRAIQAEMDASSAALAEFYNRFGDAERRLVLSKVRVTSDLDDPKVTARLRYEPRHAAFTSGGPRLLDLLIKPLYGDAWWVGPRELVQNAVDAVRELDRYRTNHPAAAAGLAQYDQPAHVVVDITQEPGAGNMMRWWCTVTDKGVGMTPDTVVEYFLRAGATFRMSDAWKAEYGGGPAARKVLRAGRFGVGALAAFLLGPEVEVTTRHPSMPEGVRFRAALTTDPVELVRVPAADAPVGTRVRVEIAHPEFRPRILDDGSYALFEQGSGQMSSDVFDEPERAAIRSFDIYGLTDVLVERRVQGTVLPQSKSLPPEAPPPGLARPPAGWNRVRCGGRNVHLDWAAVGHHGLYLNGLMVAYRGGRWWPAGHGPAPAAVSIFDPDVVVPVKLRRDMLDDDWIELVPELTADVIADCAAAWVALAPSSPEFDYHSSLPYDRYLRGPGGDNPLFGIRLPPAWLFGHEGSRPWADAAMDRAPAGVAAVVFVARTADLRRPRTRPGLAFSLCQFASPPSQFQLPAKAGYNLIGELNLLDAAPANATLQGVRVTLDGVITPGEATDQADRPGPPPWTVQELRSELLYYGGPLAVIEYHTRDADPAVNRHDVRDPKRPAAWAQRVVDAHLGGDAEIPYDRAARRRKFPRLFRDMPDRIRFWEEWGLRGP